MPNVLTVLKRVVVSLSVVAVACGYPAAAYADTTDPSSTDSSTTSTSTDTGSATPADTSTTPSTDTSSSSTPTDTSSTPTDTSSTTQTSSPTTTSSTSSSGPTQPTGADATTYTYNPATGMWENAYYIWNPVTHQTQPKTPQTYSYNPATGMWDTTQYVYDAPSGKYVPNVVSVSQPPASTPKSLSTTATGPNSNNSINLNNNANGTFNLFYNTNISNNIRQTATTGNALVQGNTAAGSALTGNAQDIANILNMLQSSASLSVQNPLLFTANLQGDVTGDLLLDPNAIASMTGPNSNNQTNVNNNGNLTVNATDSTQLNNNVALDATSGNAAVSGNTSGGDATSGNANAVANIVNMLNSAVGAGQSFIGTINIYGNLNGDILLPPGFLDSLLASNTGPNSTNTANINNNVNVNANLTNDTAINNNVTTAASTGDASVTGNTSAGSATSGNALTNVTILNLTGKDVVAANDLLVFVNVLGKWVGLIMNAPAGSTAAEVGGGISSTGPNSNNQTNVNNNLNVDANLTNNNQINNNVSVNSKSGDATVSNNTLGGNARTGNATASVNLANLVNSHLSLSSWFGILFINVFGTWNGSFGINTAAGNPVVADSAAGNPVAGSAGPGSVRAFQFVPTSGGYGLNAVGSSDSTPTDTPALASAHVLGSSVHLPNVPKNTKVASHNNFWFSAIGLGLGASLFALDRFLTLRERRV